MATKIVTKNSSTASAVPTASDLVQGELAVNVADKRLFTEDNGGAIVELGTNPYNFTANHDGSAKLATTSTGIDVTGTVTADGLTVDATLTTIGSGGATNQATELRLAGTSNAGNGAYIRGQRGGSSAFLIGDTAGALGSGTGVINYVYGANPWLVYTNGTERLRIDSSGNVGIGTSSPSEKLTVDAQSADGVTTTIASFHSNEGESGDTAIQLAVKRSDSLGSDRKTFLNATGAGNFEIQRSGTTAATIDSSGNVGIGTSSPDAPLTLNGSSSSRLNMRAGDTRYGTFFADSGVFAVSSIGSTPLVLGTNDTERMRIDSSGNLLVGGTAYEGSTTSNASSAYIASNGFISANVTNDFGMQVNRTGSDGKLFNLRKDGVDVGSIGTNGGRPYFVNPTYGGLRIDDYRLNPATTAGANWDNALDLGAGGTRFKNLYLSGGVYLGGTGAANKLDDYESGTWTPYLEKASSSPTVSYQYQVGTYTKIGNLVFAFFDLNATSISGGSGAPRIIGLPFTVSLSQAGYSAVNFRDSFVFAGIANTVLRGYAEQNNSYLVPQIDNTGSAGYGTNSNPNYNSSGRATGYIVYQAS